MNTVTCPGCLGHFQDVDGPQHTYLTVSAGCWMRFGQVLTLHYSDYRYWPAHQLLTDAYSLQHSLGDDRRAIRSRYIHLAGLYAQIIQEQSEARIIALRRALSQTDFFDQHRDVPTPTRSITSVDLSGPKQHLTSVREFAQSVLTDWSAFHALAQELCEI